MSRSASLVIGAAAAVAVAAPRPAHADLFKLFGEVQGGAMTGQGTGGDQKDSAFFANAPHGVYGAEVGAEIAIVDFYIQHHQYTNGSRLATWTQFGTGLHFELDLGDDPPPPPPDPTAHSNLAAAKRPPPDRARSGPFIEVAANVYFGLGTGQQVDLPLDNAQLTDKALIAEAKFGVGKHMSNLIDLGISIPASYGYFIKSGRGAVVNDLSTHYQGWQVEGLAYLRLNLRIL